MFRHPFFHPARLRVGAEFADWLSSWRFTRMVTLQFNDWHNQRLPETSRPEAIRKQLRFWDAQVNRHLLGHYWASSPDRIFCFFVPEKIEVSPHWHGLVRFFTDDLAWRTEQERKFDRYAPIAWSKAAPYGSCEVSVVSDQETARDYLAKSLPYEVNFENVVVPDEFLSR